MVLDVGCADKGIVRSMPAGVAYFGLDFPSTAQGLYRTTPDVFGDAQSLPFEDGSFDTIMLLDVLEHVSRPELALAEAARVLSGHGRLLITIPFAYPMHDQPHDYQRFTEHGLVHRLGLAGLKPVSITEVGTAIEAAVATACIALVQGGMDAIAARSWRAAWVPLVPVIVFLANLAAWALSRMLPTRHLMPGGYYVEAALD